MIRKSGIILLFVFSIAHVLISYSQSPKAKKVQRIIDRAVAEKLPGIAIYIKGPNYGEWIGVAGYADLESKISLQKNHIFALGSIGKMYNAVTALKLVEDGSLKLDDKISSYLPTEIKSDLPHGELITIRHLLGNTSGIYNYETDPKLNQQYISGQLSLDTLNHLNVLKHYVFGKPSLNMPGEAYHYSSTNFMLLAMIMDNVTEHGHTDYLRKNILVKNGFNNTYYRQTPPDHLLNHYGDLNQDGQVENLTKQTIETTNWFIGDDGIYAPISEASHFLESLMKGKIVSHESLKEMTTWNDPKKPDYGLGLMADKSFPYQFLIGHSGRGIGMTTDLFYFPKQDMTVAIFCNMGIRGAAPEFKKAYLKMRTKIVKRLFLF
jgi:D-alanyl-D-alanine carboxypeptidase